MNACIDLHVHTTVSDGTLTPTEVATLAAQKNLAAIAITDHDTLDGIKEATNTAQKYNLTIIPGVELSTFVEGFGSVHLVGLWIDLDHQRFAYEMAKLQDGRKIRNEAIISALVELGFKIHIDQVKQLAGNSVIGRLHIASVLVNTGQIGSIKEAFDHYLRFGKPAYRHRYRLNPQNAISLIKDAGGVAILAHPGMINFTENKLEDLITQLKSYGLDGIEIIYPEHTKELREKLTEIARIYNLAISGGSDFHGANKPGIELGSQNVPLYLLEALKNRRKVSTDANPS